MSQICALVDDKAFDLMEHRRMRRVTGGTINPARREDANRLFLPGHRADLHGRSMSAQQHAMPVALVREIECVVHRTRGMGLRDVKRTEIVPVILNLRSRRHGETEVREYFGEFVHHLTAWIDRKSTRLNSRH